VPTVAVAHAPEEATTQSADQPPPQSAPQPAPQLAAQSTAPDVALEANGANRAFEDTNPSVWSGPIHPSSPDPSLATTLADTPVDDAADTSVGTSADRPPASIAPAPSPRATKHAANAAESNAQSATGHSTRETRLAQQERRASSKHKDGLFARIGQFFRRVSYRQHDNGRQQQDPYTHP
jgi:hypothetical protein